MGLASLVKLHIYNYTKLIAHMNTFINNFITPPLWLCELYPPPYQRPFMPQLYKIFLVDNSNHIKDRLNILTQLICIGYQLNLAEQMGGTVVSLKMWWLSFPTPLLND